MNEIEQYQQAIAELRVANEKAKRLVDIVLDATPLLEDWKRTMISNASAGGFPAEVALNSQRRTIDASTWPTGEDLAEVFSAYHTARGNLRKAYNSIPANQREVVQPMDVIESKLPKRFIR